MFFKKFHEGAIRDNAVDQIVLYGHTLGFFTEL